MDIIITYRIRKFARRFQPGTIVNSGVIRSAEILLEANEVILAGGILEAQDIITRAEHVNKTGGIITTLRDPNACNCLDIAIYGSFTAYRDLSSYNAIYSYCGMTKRQQYLFTRPSEWLENFVCNVNNRCPDSCTCYSQPSNATFHVLCSGLGLTELPLYLPSPNVPYNVFQQAPLEGDVNNPITSYKLDLSGNNVQMLEARP